MVRIGLIIILALTLSITSSAQAHVPLNCNKLFDDISQKLQNAVRNSKRISALIQNIEPNRTRHYNWFDQYERLAIAIVNFLGALSEQNIALKKAIKCVDNKSATAQQLRVIDEARCRLSATRDVRPENARSFIGRGWRESEVENRTDLCMKALGYEVKKKSEENEDK